MSIFYPVFIILPGLFNPWKAVVVLAARPTTHWRQYNGMA
jgi:hypothetical protein